MLDPFHEARGPVRWFLRATGFAAITLPTRRVYVLREHAGDLGLLAHEAVHLDQIARLGPVRFTLVYLWQLIRYGYERHPLEVEARDRSGHR
jgi:hypothetical protein